MRKARNDSTAEAVRVLATAASAVSPPASVPLSPADLPFFEAIVDELAASEWTLHQLEVAALLARIMADLEREQRLLRTEGSVLASDRGSPSSIRARGWLRTSRPRSCRSGARCNSTPAPNAGPGGRRRASAARSRRSRRTFPRATACWGDTSQ